MSQDAQIKHMVDRFLSWKLPESFSPDAGITFKKTFNEHTDQPMKHEPTGTNLFDATQAEAMVRYMIEGLPASPVSATWQPTHRHYKGGLYRETGRGRREADMIRNVYYENDRGEKFDRPATEFDGYVMVETPDGTSYPRRYELLGK